MNNDRRFCKINQYDVNILHIQEGEVLLLVCEHSILSHGYHCSQKCVYSSEIQEGVRGIASSKLNTDGTIPMEFILDIYAPMGVKDYTSELAYKKYPKKIISRKIPESSDPKDRILKLLDVFENDPGYYRLKAEQLNLAKSSMDSLIAFGMVAVPLLCEVLESHTRLGTSYNYEFVVRALGEIRDARAIGTLVSVITSDWPFSYHVRNEVSDALFKFFRNDISLEDLQALSKLDPGGTKINKSEYYDGCSHPYVVVTVGYPKLVKMAKEEMERRRGF